MEDDSSDIEDYLNYEHTEEAIKYENKLKEQYNIIDSDSSSRECSPDKERNKTGSFISLLNILKTVKKSKTKETFSSTKSKVINFSETKQTYSKSDMDLSEISSSCSNIKKLFETETAMSQKYHTVRDCDDFSEVKASVRKKEFEKVINMPSAVSERSDQKLDVDLPSVNHFKSMFESGELSSTTVHDYIENRSVVRKSQGKLNDLTEEDFDGSQSIDAELEALRRSSKMKKINLVERGKGNESKPSLRRSNSCVGIAGEQATQELDDETLHDLSVSNRMVKAMFESTAPKYRFGGSGSNLSLTASQEEVSKRSAKTSAPRSTSKFKDDRRWVMDSINKYFDVIVEEDDEQVELSEDETDNDSESVSSYEEVSEESDEEPSIDHKQESNFKSSSRMRGLLGSVMTKISGSVGNLAERDLVSNLKRNLGSKISLRSSAKDLTQ